MLDNQIGFDESHCDVSPKREYNNSPSENNGRNAFDDDKISNENNYSIWGILCIMYMHFYTALKDVMTSLCFVISALKGSVKKINHVY